MQVVVGVEQKQSQQIMPERQAGIEFDCLLSVGQPRGRVDAILRRSDTQARDSIVGIIVDLRLELADRCVVVVGVRISGASAFQPYIFLPR